MHCKGVTGFLADTFINNICRSLTHDAIIQKLAIFTDVGKKIYRRPQSNKYHTIKCVSLTVL